MRAVRNRQHWIVAAAVSCLALGVAGCATEAPTTATTALAAPVGTEGAVVFADGTITIGSGARIVDAYLDPMCPYCKLFEQTSGRMLLQDAVSGVTTVRLHPVAILNRYSQGTDYSTRAAAVLTAVAAQHPEKVPAFLTALYDAQPAENTPGLTDAALLELAADAGAPVTTADLPAYRTWVDQQTQRATAGPLPSPTQLPRLEHVPTVIVDGDVYPGNTSETDRFAAFYRAHTPETAATPTPTP